jgi:hypothetical protein
MRRILLASAALVALAGAAQAAPLSSLPGGYSGEARQSAGGEPLNLNDLLRDPSNDLNLREPIRSPSRSYSEPFPWMISSGGDYGFWFETYSLAGHQDEASQSSMSSISSALGG